MKEPIFIKGSLVGNKLKALGQTMILKNNVLPLDCFTETQLSEILEQKRKADSYEDKIKKMVSSVNKIVNDHKISIHLEIDEKTLNKINYYVLEGNEISPRLRSQMESIRSKSNDLKDELMDSQETLLEKNTTIARLELEVFKANREIQELEEKLKEALSKKPQE